MPHRAQAISLRGNGSESGDIAHVAEQVPHWKHLMNVVPLCRINPRINSGSGVTQTGSPFSDGCGDVRYISVTSPSDRFSAVSTVACPPCSPPVFPDGICLDILRLYHIPLKGFIPYCSMTFSWNALNISGIR